jgi:hypothetical protein
MIVTFGKFNGDVRQITKLMTDGVEVTGTLRDKCDVLNPELLVKTDVRKFNYVYIEEFKRYYYVKDITQYRQGMWVVKLKVDVLMSYRDAILEFNGVVSRLNDSDYVNGASVFDSRDLHQRIDWDDELKLGSHILVAKGGH